MNDYNDVILKYRSCEMTIAEREEFNRDFSTNMQLRKEFVFQEKLDKVMKQNLSLEAIESDPDLIKAEILARQDIDNYMNKKGLRHFETNVINKLEVETEVEMRKRIAKAEVEMVLAGIDDISEEWVREFDQNRASMQNDIAAQKIIEFVKKSEPFNENVLQMPTLSQRFNRTVVLQVAAAVLILSLLLFKSLTPSYSGDSVYKHNYEPLEANSFQLRGNTQDVNGSLREGVDYYLSKNYSKAQLAFDNLLKSNNHQPELLLFAGLNQMGQNHFPAAITFFNDLLADEGQFIPEAQWYLGLCYIKTGEIQKARSIMTTLSENEGLYKKKAQLILKNLNR